MARRHNAFINGLSCFINWLYEGALFWPHTPPAQFMSFSIDLYSFVRFSQLIPYPRRFHARIWNRRILVKRLGPKVFAHLSRQWPITVTEKIQWTLENVTEQTCKFSFLTRLHLLATQTSLPAIIIEPCAWLTLHESKYKRSWNVVTLILVGLAKQFELITLTQLCL